MTKYKITIEYDGTAYLGWQRQKERPTVQLAIETAIKSFCAQKVTLFGAGRTDAGVHATGQVAHFEIDGNHEPYKVMMGVNNFLREQCLEAKEKLRKILKNHSMDKISLEVLNHLPVQDIAIVDCEIAEPDFHARFSAKKRFYKYRILNASNSSALRAKRAWYVYEKLDVAKMQKACQFLIGTHDFSSFRDSACQAKSPVKTMDTATVRKEGDEIIFEISGESFLHHMVRNIVGTLRLVGNGKISVEDFQKILEAKDRTKAGMTAVAHGLYFMGVEY